MRNFHLVVDILMITKHDSRTLQCTWWLKISVSSHGHHPVGRRDTIKGDTSKIQTTPGDYDDGEEDSGHKIEGDTSKIQTWCSWWLWCKWWWWWGGWLRIVTATNDGKGKVHISNCRKYLIHVSFTPGSHQTPSKWEGKIDHWRLSIESSVEIWHMFTSLRLSYEKTWSNKSQ